MKMKLLSILLVLAMLAASLGAFTAAEESTLPFTDVSVSNWFYDEVLSVYERGVMNGTSDTLFEPTASVTRAQAVAILARLAGENDESVKSYSENIKFSDVLPSQWYAGYLGWSVENKLILGYPDGTFRGTKAINRAELAKILVAFFERFDIKSDSETLIDSFADANSHPGWAKEYIEKSRVLGLIGGDENGNFNALSSATRAQIATIITRIPSISDESDDVIFQIAKDVTPYMNLYAEKPVFVFADQVTKELFEFRLLVAFELNTAKYAVNFTVADGFFDELTSALTALESDTQTEITTPLTFTLKNLETSEETGEISIDSFLLRRCLTDPVSDNLGTSFADAELELKISAAVKIADENGTIPTCVSGWHGTHETRVVRTELGTYCVYVTEENLPPVEGGWYTQMKFAIVKITSEGCKVLREAQCPMWASTHAPNILAGENGKVYVTNIGDDMDSWRTAEDRAIAWLDIYVIDEYTEEVKYVSERYPFQTIRAVDHGYGKSQPMIDLENGKIYALFNGGSTTPGMIAWFIFDLETETWETECHTIYDLPWTYVYPNIYPDGNGGIYYIVERCGDMDVLYDKFGFEFKYSGYLWDAIYIFHIKDMYATDYEVVEVFVPEYSTTEENFNVGACHYGSGCTYKDFDGNLHIIYSVTLSKTNTEVYHAVYDKDLNELYHEKVETTYSRNHKSSYGLTQSTDGTYYMLIAHNDSNSQSKTEGACIEIRSSTDGFNFKRIVKEIEVTLPDGTNINDGRIVIGNVRNNSVKDNIVPVVFADETNKCYYYYSVELPA